MVSKQSCTLALILSVFVGHVLGYTIPQPQFEELSPQGFRVSIEDDPGIKMFAFHAKRSEPFTGTEPGDIHGTVMTKTNGRWAFVSPLTRLDIGDTLHYWIYVQHGVLGFRLEAQKYIATGIPGITQTSEETTTSDIDIRIPSLDETTTTTTTTTTTPIAAVVSTSGICVPSISTVRGQATCSGALMFEENFTSDLGTKWQHEVLIPLDTEDAEFLSYQNVERVCFIASERLSVWPKLLTALPGFTRLTAGATLDLGAQCTATINLERQCRRKAQFSSILPPVVSCKLNTKDSFAFQYGKIEIRAKMPKGDWLFPQLYLEPVDKDYYGEQSYASGLMRIAFVRANAVLRSSNRADIGGNILYGGVVLGTSENQNEKFAKPNKRQNHWGDQFHAYELVWTNESITVAVDGIVYGEISGGFKSDIQLTGEPQLRWNEGGWMAPFDKEFYLSLGVGVGGMTAFPDGSLTGNNRLPKPWTNFDPKAELQFWQRLQQWHSTWDRSSYGMEVDHVKVWAI